MKKDTLTKTLTIFGTLFIWFPLLAPVIFSVSRYAADQRFRFDYLMPAELFPSGLLGGILLFRAARRASSQVKPVSWGLGIAVTALVLGQALALWTGLASGEMEAAGFWFVILVASLVIYTAGMLTTGIAAIFLLKKIFGTQHPTSQEGT